MSKPKGQDSVIEFETFDSVFGGENNSPSGETIQLLPISELQAPDQHPFMVRDDDEMKKLVESVREYGVCEPGLARPLPEGGYELLCGNRRKRACELAGLTEMPVIVREMSDSAATIAMIDSNLQHREKILPSEKAWAYRYRMEALNHNGVKGELHSYEVMAAQTGEGKTQIFKTIRLTELIDKLLDLVDVRCLAFSPAVELSYLPFHEQRIVADCMEKYETKPSLSQAVKLKKLKQVGDLTAEVIEEILSEEKKPTKSDEPERNNDKGAVVFKRFFPAEYTPEQMTEVIVKLLTDWQTSTAQTEVTV